MISHLTLVPKDRYLGESGVRCLSGYGIYGEHGPGDGLSRENDLPGGSPVVRELSDFDGAPITEKENARSDMVFQARPVE